MALFAGRSGHKQAWFYTARRVATQANAGGGAIVVDITMNANQMAFVLTASARNSGTNTLAAVIYDEDMAANPFAANLIGIGSAAGNVAYVPSIGTAANATANVTFSGGGFWVGPGESLSIYQGGAGAQNDTLTIAVRMLLFNVSTDPVWSKARSTNEGDVTLAASTISAANSKQGVLI